MKKKIVLTNLRNYELQKEGMENLVGGAQDQCRTVCSCSTSCPPNDAMGPHISDHNLYQAQESTRTGGLLKLLGWYKTDGPAEL